MASGDRRLWKSPGNIQLDPDDRLGRRHHVGDRDVLIDVHGHASRKASYLCEKSFPTAPSLPGTARTITSLTSGKVVFKDDRIEFVGEVYDGPADETIDATGRLVAIPGLVNSHLHVTDTLFTKGFLEETQAPAGTGVAPNYYALYTVLPEVRRATDSDAQVAAAQCAFAELARTGALRPWWNLDTTSRSAAAAISPLPSA